MSHIVRGYGCPKRTDVSLNMLPDCPGIKSTALHAESAALYGHPERAGLLVLPCIQRAAQHQHPARAARHPARSTRHWAIGIQRELPCIQHERLCINARSMLVGKA